MKILYVITHPNKGGTQTYVYHLASTLRAQGDSITLGTGSRGWLSNELEKQGVKSVMFKFLRRTYNPLSNLFFTIEMLLFVRRHQFDIIHFNSSNPLFGILGAFISRRPSTKIVFTVHGLSLLDPGWKKSRLIQWAYRLVMTLILPYVNHCIFVCERDCTYAQRKKIIHPKKQFSIIYNGIRDDVVELDRYASRNYFGRIAQKNFLDTIIIGTIARLHYQKNIDLLISSARKLRISNVVFFILGTGPEKKRLNDLIREYTLHDSCFIFDIPEPRIYIKAFDIFISSSRYEGIPFTIMEAMKNKLPIIATDVGGVSEVLQQGNSGIIVNSENTDELVRAIQLLIQNPPQARTIGNSAFRVMQTKFTLERMVSETRALYTLLLEL